MKDNEKEFTLTPEETAEFSRKHEENSAFRGRMANMERLNRYKELRELAVSAVELCEDIVRVSEIEPKPDVRNGTIILELARIASLDRPAVEIVAKMLRLTDHFGTVVVDVLPNEQGTRFLFMVRDIWE